ncbi:MAG TPA: hypothetical protein VIZ20_12520, partial [Streptosporangiaceae bacterium]
DRRGRGPLSHGPLSHGPLGRGGLRLRGLEQHLRSLESYRGHRRGRRGGVRRAGRAAGNATPAEPGAHRTVVGATCPVT